MNFELISPAYDAELAGLIRRILKAHALDIPGTAYFDASLDHLSGFYAEPGRAYYLLTEGKKLIGGIGLAELPDLPACCEMQKLYLDENYRGRGWGRRMVDRIEQAAWEMGYQRMYLETHTNLEAAVRLYEKCGYHAIPKPDFVIHTAMNRFYLKELPA